MKASRVFVAAALQELCVRIDRGNLHVHHVAWKLLTGETGLGILRGAPRLVETSVKSSTTCLLLLNIGLLVDFVPIWRFVPLFASLCMLLTYGFVTMVVSCSCEPCKSTQSTFPLDR